MVIHKRKEKWDSFAKKVEEMREEVQTEEEKPLPSGKKTPSE